MKFIILSFALFASLNAFSFEGKYELALPFETVTIQVDADGTTRLNDNPMTPITLSSSLTAEYLDMTISWMNDGSPELTRIVFEKDANNTIQVRESYSVFNDGTPSLSFNGIRLISVAK